MPYVAHIAVLITIYAILAIALDLAVAHAGIITLGHVAVCAFGAYLTAIFNLHGTPTWVTLLLTVPTVSLVILGFGRATAKLDRDVFAIASFAGAAFITALIKNMSPITGGPRGLAGIHTISVLGYEFDTPARFLVLSLPVLGVVAYAYHLLTRAPFGRALRITQDDEVLARAFGYHTSKLKAAALAISGAGAAIAGFLYASYIRFIHPDSFTVGDSILVLTMIILGGLGGLRGAMIGATLIIIVPEVLRFIQVPTVYAANLRQILYGAVLVVCVLLRPRGLIRGARHA